MTPADVRATALEFAGDVDYLMVEQRSRRVRNPDGSVEQLDDWNVHVAGVGRFNGKSPEEVLVQLRGHLERVGR